MIVNFQVTQVDLKVPISVAIVTRNEEKNILDALESVKDFEDIVVVDAFSEDRTVEISKRYTERVFQHEWSGYSSQKQRAVDYARGQWVLILDADERVTEGLRSEMMMRVADTPFGGFYIPRRNFFLGKWIRHSGWWPDYTLRLFRKDLSKVEKREVHERVVVKGAVDYLREPLEHYSYRTISDYLRKMENYSTLAARELSTNGRTTIFPSIALNPPLTFLKMFLLRQGFRDGVQGLILAMLYSFYTFLKYAKVWEMGRKSPQTHA